LVEFFEGLRDILVVAVPAIVVAASSKFIIRSWQVEKEKFDLQKEMWAVRKTILDDYQKGFVKESIMLTHLHRRILDLYAIPRLSPTKEDKVVEEIPKADSNWSNKPLKVFGPELEKLRYEQYSAIFEEWSFFAEARIYFDDEPLVEKIYGFGRLLGDFSGVLCLLIHSESHEEFSQNLRITNDVAHKVYKEQKEIAYQLSTAKQRRYPTSQAPRKRISYSPFGKGFRKT
jgi:hypothetical protein